ncbi:MAG TPA: peptidylprolyl isomerase [Myxococcota bacterium]|nr:peptidylprolyl isomerase [Myxococcota bacterium]
MRTWFLSLLFAAVLSSPCCSPPPADPFDGLPAGEGLTENPARRPQRPAKEPETVAISHIQVSYRGAVEAWKKIEITHEQARLRAGRLLKLARSKGQEFADLARRFSNDAQTSDKGGSLGVVGRGELHPDLERAAFGLGLGQVADVVETPQGFQIVMRHEPDEAQTSEIVISYTGTERYTPRTPRTRDEAAALSHKIRARLAAGVDFADLAVEYSDLPNYSQGGFYPIFSKGTRNPKFEDIVWNLPVEGLSDVIETGTGFHIVGRRPVRRIQVRVISIGYREKESVDDDADRSRIEARALADNLHKRLVDDKDDFAALASKFSEGVGNEKGGLVPPFGRAEIPHPVEQVAFSLAPGEISGVFDATGQFQIVKRIR